MTQLNVGDETRELGRIRQELVRAFAGRVPARQVSLTVSVVFADARLFDTRVRPNMHLVEWIARDQLEALAKRPTPAARARGRPRSRLRRPTLIGV